VEAEFLFGTSPVFIGRAALVSACFPIRIGEFGNLFVSGSQNGGGHFLLRRNNFRLGNYGRERCNRLGVTLPARSDGSLSTRRSGCSRGRYHEIFFGCTLSGHVG
jgi:hypothetical protein